MFLLSFLPARHILCRQGCHCCSLMLHNCDNVAERTINCNQKIIWFRCQFGSVYMFCSSAKHHSYQREMGLKLGKHQRSKQRCHWRMLEGPRPCKISCFVLQSEGNKSCVLFTARDHWSMPEKAKEYNKICWVSKLFSLLYWNQIILYSINIKSIV